MMFLIERQTVCRLENVAEIVLKTVLPFRMYNGKFVEIMERPLESCTMLQVIVTHTHTLHARVLFNFLLECAFIFWRVVSIKAIEKCNPMHACMHTTKN